MLLVIRGWHSVCHRLLFADGIGDTSDYKTGQRACMTLTDFSHLTVMCPDLIAGTTWFRMPSSGGILWTRWRNFALHKWCNDWVMPNGRIMVRINVKVTIVYDGFGGLVVSMLASGTQVCGFKPGRIRWIFTGVKILSMPSSGGEVKESVSCPSFAACKRT